MSDLICTECGKPISRTGWDGAGNAIWVHSELNMQGWRNCSRDPNDWRKATPDTDQLEAFLKTYTHDRVALDLTIKPDEPRQFIIIRGEQGVLVINPMAFNDHYCVDLHTFVDGEKGRGGVFGMENGQRVAFHPDAVKGTSHGWPATPLVTVLVGEQKEVTSGSVRTSATT